MEDVTREMKVHAEAGFQNLSAICSIFVFESLKYYTNSIIISHINDTSMISTFLMKTRCEMDLQAAMEHVIEEHADLSGNFDKTLGLSYRPETLRGELKQTFFEISQSTSWLYMRVENQQRP